jgi:HAMP domain-containing protein
VKLVVKFNVVLLTIFLVGVAIAAYVSHRVLQSNAREEIVQNARLMMEAALSSRTYTNTQIKPLLETQLKYTFLPQTVPAYAATEVFNDMRKKHPDYGYKEATLNPTNPRDRASDWEADIVQTFRRTPTTDELVGERETPTGRALYLARPIQITNGACLVCHSTAEAAPKTMLDVYGNANGFGWQMNEVIGAQVVSVPMSVPIQRANQTFRTFMLSLAGIFLVAFVLLNVMLHFMVIRPVTKLAGVADQVSLGNFEAGEFKARTKDEIGVLTEALGRMKTSLVQAMKMLET